MSGWAALSGFANSLAGSLNKKADENIADKKRALEDKLRQDSESRAEARNIATEQRAETRERSKVDKETNIQRDGAWFTQSKNSFGDVIDEKLTDADTIEKLNFESQKRKDELAKNAIELEYLPKKNAAEIDYRDSLAGQADRAYTGLSRSGASSSGRTPKPPAFSAPAKSSLSAAFSTKGKDGKTTINQAQVNAFTKYQGENAAQDPEFNDGDYALSKYLAGKSAMKEGQLPNGETYTVAAQTPDELVPALVAARGDARKKGKDLTKDELKDMALSYIKKGDMTAPGDKPVVPSAAGGSASKADYAAEVRKAKALIASGKITKEEAAARFIKAGFPELAKAL